MSKGSKPRPIEDRDKFNKEWDRIFGSKKKQYRKASETECLYHEEVSA